jgi:D-serine/D-alanine/glycine transporter
VILTVAWQMRKRSLLRQGKPLTGTIPTVRHPLDED